MKLLAPFTKKSLSEQVKCLKGLFLGLGDPNLDLLKRIDEGAISLPSQAQNFFAIPNRQKNPNLFGSTESQAIVRILDTLKYSRNGKFKNDCRGKIEERHLRQTFRTIQSFRQLLDSQGNPSILIIPGQIGTCHCGRSPRRAWEVIERTPNEFAFGAFIVGIILLTHPECLEQNGDLQINCEEFDQTGLGTRFNYSLCYRFHDGFIRLGSKHSDEVYENSGSASGFLLE